MKISPRFTGLKLTAADRKELLRMQHSRKPQTPRRWRRIRALLLLDRGYSIRAAAAAIGGYHREVSRLAKRYLQGGGLEKVLSDEPRPKPHPMLDSTQQAALVAMVCGPPPQGRARWTVRLLAVEAGKRGVVDKVGRETVRVVLARHDLKPWREKNVVRSRNRPGVRGSDGGRA
jgi:transposase